MERCSLAVLRSGSVENSLRETTRVVREPTAMEKATQSPEPASASTPPLSADDVDWTGKELGEFRVLHRLGKGGMGEVYLAEQTSLKRKVALKVLSRNLASNDRSLQRFKSEAENVARATH